MEYKKGKKNWEAYREGYNNPGQFDQQKLLARNDDIARAIIAGITDRSKDNLTENVKFK